MADGYEFVPLTAQDVADILEAQAMAQRSISIDDPPSVMALYSVTCGIVEAHGFDPKSGAMGADANGAPILRARRSKQETFS
jgi:hypothetical protein